LIDVDLSSDDNDDNDSGDDATVGEEDCGTKGML
jgi:hypothetical protein